MAALNFNANTVAPSEAFDVLPAGWYNVRITASENKPTKDGQGSYLALTMTIIDGTAANRKVFDRLNLNNKNPKAVEIAYRTLSAICHATGVIQLQDSTQLHGIPLQVKLKVRPAEGQYGESNETDGYKKLEGAAGMPAAPTWAAAPPIATQQSPIQAHSPASPVAPAAAPVAPASTPPWAQ